jgi:hypothetical protein
VKTTRTNANGGSPYKTSREIYSERKTTKSKALIQFSSSKSYVKDKNLCLQYAMPVIEIPEYKLPFDLRVLLRKLNDLEMWNTKSCWTVLSTLDHMKKLLPAKGMAIMGLSDLISESRIKLMNLRNCVLY